MALRIHQNSPMRAKTMLDCDRALGVDDIMQYAEQHPVTLSDHGCFDSKGSTQSPKAHGSPCSIIRRWHKSPGTCSARQR